MVAAAAGQAPAASATQQQIDAEVAKLIELNKAGAAQDALVAQADVIAGLAKQAGADRVFPELNDGSFKGYTLSGQTAKRFRSVINLGTLSFNKYQPADMTLRMMATDCSGVYKGARGDTQTAYIVTAGFEFVDWDGGENEGTATGLIAQHVAIAEYRPDPDNPQRLYIEFKKLRLEPGSDEPGHLQRWLDTLLPHNPGMDPETGCLEVDLGRSPEGWLDALLMTQQWQLLAGNYGSRTLLQRV